MSRPKAAASESSQSEPSLRSGSTLPAQYTPRVAEYAEGPFLHAQLVTPQGIEFHGARTYLVETPDGTSYLALRVQVGPHFYGWWKI